MAEGETLAQRARAAVAEMKRYQEDLLRREQDYLLHEAELTEKAQRLEAVRAGLLGEAQRLRAQRAEQDGFENYLTYFFERLEIPAKRADEPYRDFARRAAEEVLRAREAEGQQGRVSYGEPAGSAVVQEAVREALAPPEGPELLISAVLRARRISDETLGPDSVSVKMEGGNLRKRILLKDPEHIHYYQKALRLMRKLPGVAVDIDPDGKYLEFRGPIGPVKVFYKAIAANVETARGSAEVDEALRRLAQ